MDKIILDANVLFSNTLRSLFLWILWGGNACEIAWTKEIWEEVFRNYSSDPVKEKAFRSRMENGPIVMFSSCLRNLESSYQTVGLPDPNDEHIVAIARQEKFDEIVTFNLRDFPNALLAPYGIKSCTPDAYLCDLFSRENEVVIDSVMRHISANNVTRPAKNIYFESLRNSSVPLFANSLAEQDAAEKLFPEIWN